MKAPAFQFYARDFRASLSVAVMSSAQRGGYIMLLSAAWDFDQPGYLPNDDDLLRLFSGMTESEWQAGRERLLKQFPLTEDGSLRYNARLLSEVEKQANYRESRAKGGQAAAAKRAAGQHKPSIESSYAETAAAHDEPEASIAPTLLSASAICKEQPMPDAGPASPSPALVGPIEEEVHPTPPTPLKAQREGRRQTGNEGGPLSFAAFWQAYHGPDCEKRGSKKVAERRWNKLNDATRQHILAGVDAFRADATRNGNQYLEYAEKFLNPERAVYATEAYGKLPTAKALPRGLPAMPDDPRDLWGFNAPPTTAEPVVAYATGHHASTFR